MTLPELKALAKRTTFRDWEPYFKVYDGHGDGDFLFYWKTDKTGSQGISERHYFIGSDQSQDQVIELMRDSAIEMSAALARHDFKVEPKGKPNERSRNQSY